MTFAAHQPQYDFIIVGAGAVGCSIARELSKYQVSVLVLEKSADVSQGASKANSGIVHGGYDEKHGTLKSKLARKGNQLFKQLDKELHFGLRTVGSLVLAKTDKDVRILNHLLVNGQKNGVDDLSIIDAKRLYEMEPHLKQGFVAALYCPSAAITSPYEYVIATAENAAQNGVVFLLEREVNDIHVEELDHQQMFSVSTLEESFVSKFVINCAGLSADRIAALVGARNFSIIPRKGEYILLDKTQGHIANHVLFPVPDPTAGKGMLVSPTYWGNLLLGPTSRGLEEKQPTKQEILQSIIDAAHDMVDQFDTKRVLTSYSGLRAKCDRKDFIVEESASVHHFINVAGIDSPGLTSSPAIAKMVVEDIIQPKYPMKFKTHFQPIRQPIIRKKPQDFQGKVDHENPNLNIICKCETVTESEVLEAIHRAPLDETVWKRDKDDLQFSPFQTMSKLQNNITIEQDHPHLLHIPSTDSVKRRTRCGMGVCQGKFCEDRVAEIIGREMNVPIQFVPRRGKGSSLLPSRRVHGIDIEDLVRKPKSKI